MNKMIIRFAFALVLLTACGHAGFAQSSSVTEDDTRASLNISKNIIRLIGYLAKDYVAIKSDLITKTDDGTSVYKVSNLDGMMAESEYVMIKSGGAAYYIASYSATKNVTMSFAAFTGGVTTLTNADGNFSIAQDKDKSKGDNLVYVMSVKGTKVGSYTMDTKKKEGTMIIGFL